MMMVMAVPRCTRHAPICQMLHKHKTKKYSLPKEVVTQMYGCMTHVHWDPEEMNDKSPRVAAQQLVIIIMFTSSKLKKIEQKGYLDKLKILHHRNLYQYSFTPAFSQVKSTPDTLGASI